MGGGSAQPAGRMLWERFADLHSHIIPDVDDGSASFEESLAMIGVAYKSGVRRLCATSHVREQWPNAAEALQAKFTELAARTKAAGMADMTLHLSAEYMLDEAFFALLRKGNLLPLPGKLLLVEISYYAPPLNLNDMLFEITTHGYTPLIAHPERYGYYHNHIQQYAAFKEKGYPFQLDLLSLQGSYGKSVQKTALMLLEKGYINYVGSDMHSVNDAQTVAAFLQSPASAPLTRWLQRKDF